MATERQKKAFEELVDKRSEKVRSVGEAMEKAGYSKSASTKPAILTKSNGWKELMAKHMPEELIAKKHLALLNKKECIQQRDPETGTTELIRTEEIDVTAVSKGLDMYYKIGNKYPKEGSTTAVQVNIGDRIKEMRNEYKK